MNSLKWIVITITLIILIILGLLIGREISDRGETRLIVMTEPEKAEVYLSGRRFIAPIDTLLPAGTYRVQIVAPGRKPFDKTIRIRPNRTNRLNFSLDPEDTFLPPEGSP